MGGGGKMVEGDGMFLIGKRKCGVGRYHSKEHIYVCLERGSRKIRRVVVRDKSADALSVFAKHLKPNTEMCVDPGTENTFFDNLPAIVQLHKIPGPIHVDANDPRKNTQTVERSHSSIKMRLRMGRGIFRHNLQPIMDFEDFVYNRSDGTPIGIFQKLGDATKAYCSTADSVTRLSNIPLLLGADHFEKVEGLTITDIQSICTDSIFNKAKRYEIIKSNLISTQVYPSTNTIEGEFRAARIHDQIICWNDDHHGPSGDAFSLERLQVTCSCKYFLKNTLRLLPDEHRYCTHVIGQLRRVLFMN